MIFDNYYINLSNTLCINTINPYKTIRNRFFVKYIEMYSHNYSDREKMYLDALTYSKYYLYYKIYNCVYSNEIMEIIFNIDNM